MHEIGRPTVTVSVSQGTQEEIRQNREKVKMAFEFVLTKRCGCDTKVILNWENNTNLR